MAKLLPPQILTPSSSLLFPSSTPTQKSLSFAISVKTDAKFLFSGNSRGAMKALKAYSAAASSGVVPDDVANELGKVSIFRATGESVKFSDLWDQKEDKTFSRRDSLKKAMENYTIKATPNISSVFQQGGMFVFKGKQLLYARKDEVTGDHAPLEDVFDICCKVPLA